MTMFKRIVATFLILVLCLSVMSACNLMPKTDEELIESRINKFVNSFNSGDLNAVAECLDAKTRNTFKSATNIANALLGKTGFAVSITDFFGLAVGIFSEGDVISVSDMKVSITDGTTARADVIFGYKDKSGDVKEEMFFTMVKEEDDWFIKDLEGRRGPNDDKVQKYLEDADEYYANKNYLSALQKYEAALELNKYSEEAANGVAKAKESYKKSVIQQADNYIADKNYSTAERVLRDGLRYLTNDSELEDKLNGIQDQKIEDAVKIAEDYIAKKDYISALRQYESILASYGDSQEASGGLAKVKEACRHGILTQTNAYIDDRDYSSAEMILKQGLQYLPNDTELTNALNGMEEVKIKNIVDDAYSYTEGGDWDSAVELLEEAQSQFKNDSSIITAYNDIKEKMPYTLKNITTVSSKNIKVIKDVTKDRYGNVYDGAVMFDASNDGYALYNLGGGFTNFTATAFVAREASIGKKMSISIYVDEKLVLFEDEITEESQPIEISITVNGGNTLRIVTNNDGSYTCGRLYFGNSSFEKIEKQ